MKWKQYTAVILIITTLAIAYYFLIDKEPSISNLPEQLSVSNHQKADDLHPEKLKPFNDEKKTTPTKNEFSAVDAREAAEWMRKNGRYTKDERDDYQYYDDKTLESLGQTGDIKALTILGSRYITEYRDTQKASYYYDLAAIRGSIHAIAALEIINAPNPMQSASERRASALDALSFSKAIELRGDEHFSKLEKEKIIQGYEQVFGEKLLLSSDDENIIDEKANQLYNKWIVERQTLGLGDFDNTQPEGLKKIFK